MCYVIENCKKMSMFCLIKSVEKLEMFCFGLNVFLFISFKK